MNIPATMRALEQTTLKGPQDMRLVSAAAVPTPGPGEVLIAVEAAGVNFADVSKAHGVFRNGPQPPYIAGFEAAGEVVAVGEGVSAPQLGARVVGVGAGAFAEYMVLPAAAAVPVPAGWSSEQSLGLVVNWPTALAALKPLGRVAPGETVLIHAAAGATGQAAVVLAKHYGATVIATASPTKHETVRALGADHVLNSRAGDLTVNGPTADDGTVSDTAALAATDLTTAVLARTDGAGADLVLETSGGAAFAAGLAAAKRVTGRVVVFGLAGGEATLTNWDLVYRHQVQVIGLNLGALIQSAPHVFGEVMGELAQLIASGVLAPSEPATYALTDGARALLDLEGRRTVGKLALRP